MAEISAPEEEFGEPALNYWKPVAKPPPVVLPPFVPNCIGNGYEHCGWTFQIPPYNQPAHPPPYVYHQAYPLANVIHSYVQNQQIVPPQGDTACDMQRQQLSQCSLIGPDQVLYTLSANPSFEQDPQSMTDSMIQDEVTRAAKTLFSKRNRTLLHWLNPDINKNQIKIDVNAAWESLPPAEKMFYISQVLGKFSPHVTSLMVNPQLEPSQVKSSCVDRNCGKTTEGEAKSSPGAKVKRKTKKTSHKNKLEVNSTIKEEIKTEDEESRESSGLVVDVSKVKEPKEICSNGEKPRVKRKYTKRKRKESSEDQNVINSTNSCPLPVDIKNIKLEPGTDFPIDPKDIKIEPGIDFPVDIKKEPGTEFPVDVKDIKVEPGTKIDKNQNNILPRPKRKYIKRKLVRKKYKKREPKQKPPINSTDCSGKGGDDEKGTESIQNDQEDIEMDLWIELGDDSILTNEEVDSFFDSIEDPDSLFRELGIIEN